MNLCQKLNFKFSEIVREDWVFPNVYNSQRFLTAVSTAQEIFKPEWITDLENRGLRLKTVRLFYRRKGFNDPNAHIDHFVDGNGLFALANFGINFVLGGEGSEMIWYELPKHLYPAVGELFDESPDNWQRFNCDWKPKILGPELGRAIIDEQATLVNVTVPHQIKMSDKPRWCISVRPMHSDWTYEDVLKFMTENNFLSS